MEENRSIFQGEVWIEGDMVTYVGQGPETTGGNVPKWDREIDGQGNLLMPGFKNCPYPFRNDIFKIPRRRHEAG